MERRILIRCLRPATAMVATTVAGAMLATSAISAQDRKTVGADGTFSTIQLAIDNCSSGTDCDVDVQGGATYNENLVIPSTWTAAKMAITGGWDSDFLVRNLEPSSTIIDGGGTGKVMDVKIGGGSFTLRGLTVTNGSAIGGAGIHVLPTGATASKVELSNLIVENNHAIFAGSSQGGGIWGELDDTENLDILGCEVKNNSVTVTSGTSAAAGAGIMVTASGTATFLIDDVWIENNTASSDTGRKDGVGLFAGVIGDASGALYDLRVTGNTAAGTFNQVNGSGGLLNLNTNGQMVVERTSWAANTDTTGAASDQLKLFCQGNGTLRFSDSVVAFGDKNGLYGFTNSTAELQLNNLTVVDNTLTGIYLLETDTSTVTLYNSISYGNGTDSNFDPGVETGNNLIGTDPLFMNPGTTAPNYHLDFGSPGIDMGNNAPPGGLGTLDLDLQERVQDGTVDMGCYETVALLFYDGFEGGGTGEWSTTVP